MTSIMIITIVIVALLTIVIFGLVWLGYNSCLKLYKVEVNQGKHDEVIYKKYHVKKKKSGLVGTISSYVALLALLGLFVTGISYRANGENFSFNNQTALVIKSGSMSNFYDDKIAEKYNYDRSLQFDIGDICMFEKATNLVEGEVYGYKQNNIIITHRLVKFWDSDLCEFRGDNNPVSDSLITKDKIIYHYIGNRIPGLGVFILYAQSYFGIWSLVGIIGVIISSEVLYYKINKVEKIYLKGKHNEIQDSNIPN